MSILTNVESVLVDHVKKMIFGKGIESELFEILKRGKLITITWVTILLSTEQR